MQNKLQVKEHLRNQDLYKSSDESYINSVWKTKLFRQYAMKQELKNALMERPPFFKWFLCICIVIMCFSFSIAAYLGFINPAHWFDNIGQITKYKIPVIGIKEVLIFVILINGLTFMIRKRSYFI